ncbi:hypothetical protein CAAN3_17S02850 [[Candida] anglica]
MMIDSRLSIEKKNTQMSSPQLNGGPSRPVLLGSNSTNSLHQHSNHNQPHHNHNNHNGGRKRSNSRSQVVSLPQLPQSNTSSNSNEHPDKRSQMQYIVTLIPLNDTFIKKNLLVPYFPETLKLGRPAGSKVKPEINNGYFDSRVLSRNHAAIFVDPSNGKLMIKDLGSSNGTFVNKLKIGSDPIELKIGDIIYLGFNIEVDTSHKKISAKIENINMMPNYLKTGDISTLVLSSPTSSASSASASALARSKGVDSPEYKHYTFIQSIFSNASNEPNNEPPISFDNAIFGDINPNLEGSLLGLNPKGGCGIFNNSQITNSVSLEQTINLLATNLSKVKQQNSTLKSLEDFILKYQSRLNEMNQNYITDQFEKTVQQYQQKISEESQSTNKIKSEYEKYRIKSNSKVSQLEKEMKLLQSETDSLKSQLKASKLAIRNADMESRDLVATRASLNSNSNSNSNVSNSLPSQVIAQEPIQESIDMEVGRESSKIQAVGVTPPVSDEEEEDIPSHQGQQEEDPQSHNQVSTAPVENNKEESPFSESSTISTGTDREIDNEKLKTTTTDIPIETALKPLLGFQPFNLIIISVVSVMIISLVLSFLNGSKFTIGKYSPEIVEEYID